MILPAVREQAKCINAKEKTLKSSAFEKTGKEAV